MASAGGGIDAPVPSDRWQEGDESVRGVTWVVCNAGGSVQIA